MAYIHTPLVVIFSTLYRDWDNPIAYASQVELINHLTAVLNRHFGINGTPIIGIHYWTEKYGRDYPELAPELPTLAIQQFPYKHTITSQHDKDTLPGNPEYTIQSTRKAFENAEALHQELFGCPMPAHQPILRLRPDLVIRNISNFPSFEFDHRSGLYYKSMWNTFHRPIWKDSCPEAGDAIALTTKAALRWICSIPLTSYADIYKKYNDKGLTINFAERYLYAIIDSTMVDVLHDPNIKVGVLRSNNHVDYLQRD